MSIFPEGKHSIQTIFNGYKVFPLYKCLTMAFPIHIVLFPIFTMNNVIKNVFRSIAFKHQFSGFLGKQPQKQSCRAKGQGICKDSECKLSKLISVRPLCSHSASKAPYLPRLQNAPSRLGLSHPHPPSPHRPQLENQQQLLVACRPREASVLNLVAPSPIGVDQRCQPTRGSQCRTRAGLTTFSPICSNTGKLKWVKRVIINKMYSGWKCCPLSTVNVLPNWGAEDCSFFPWGGNNS